MQIFQSHKSKVKSQNYGSLMPMRRFVRLFNEIAAVVDDIKRNQPQFTPSYFEILVAASFKLFAEEKVDWAVVEVGLGGRLDATNILTPKVSVITNIGLDHTEILGKTIEKIAREKAGIIKQGIPAVTGASGKAFKVIAVIAHEKQSPLIKINTQYVPNALSLCHFPVSGLLSLAAVETAGIKLNTDDVFTALETVFPGRLEEFGDVIIDGAHNPDKIKFLLSYVRSLRTKQKVNLVVAFKKGKNWKKMADLLIKNLPIDEIVATKYQAVTDTGAGSAVEPSEIANYVKSRLRQGYGGQARSKLKVMSIEDSQGAVFAAIDTRNTVIVTGSLYLVGEVRTMWHLPSFA
jgi:dihydrofolate synthase/folylpolyglutamate synthase